MAARKKKPTGPVPVESVRHDERRTTIPTAELADLVPDDADRKGLRYPRDPSLDPQLVWKGKDDEDGRDLVVNPVPIYVQEKIVPQALVENLRKTSKSGEPEPEATLFDDFDGLDDLEMVDFYEHEKGNWTNRMILGDSLAIMASLAEREDLRGKVQMIYIDPPYGIKFGSNWQVSTRKRDVTDGKPADATREPEVVKAFRDTWELGIHSYLGYLRDRLEVARDLLTETGSCFVQIGDENVHLVRALLDEVFGAENFASLITFAKTGTTDTDRLAATHDYIIWYAKDVGQMRYRQVFEPRRERTEGGTFTWIELMDGSSRRMTRAEKDNPATLPEGARRFRADNVSSQGESTKPSEPVEFEESTYRCSPGRHWKRETIEQLIAANRIVAQGKTLAYKRFEDDFPVMPRTHVWDDTILGTFSTKWYVVQTGDRAVERCVLMTTDPGDLILDPTCGVLG